MFIALLLVKRTRIIILKELETVKNNIKYPRIDVTFDEDHKDNDKFYQKQEFEEPIEDQIIKKKREAEIKKVIKNKHNPYLNSVGNISNEIPSKIATISSLSRKEVYSESGNFMGIVKRAVLSRKRVIGWIIKPSKSYNLTKDIFVKHKYIKEIESIFIIDKRIEDHILHKEKILDFTRTDKFLNYFKKIKDSKKLKRFSIKKDKTKEW
jgi:sporulation protein YlmC with PRC-barrel domain